MTPILFKEYTHEVSPNIKSLSHGFSSCRIQDFFVAIVGNLGKDVKHEAQCPMSFADMQYKTYCSSRDFVLNTSHEPAINNLI